MKRLLASALALFIITQGFAQKKDEMTHKNSWLKAGLEASVPVGDLSDYSNFALGVEVSGQYMVHPHFGIGIATGYTNYFIKDGDDFGAIPLGALLRYYPKAEGFFIGTDLGYTFLTNFSNNSGGFYVKPQLGYHNYSWNFYGFYNHVFSQSPYIDVQNVGVAATYNLRFKK